MKTTLVRLPRYADELTKEAEEAIQLLNGVWREATNLFLADTDSSLKRKKKHSTKDLKKQKKVFSGN